jgi:hypothetical protein
MRGWMSALNATFLLRSELLKDDIWGISKSSESHTSRTMEGLKGRCWASTYLAVEIERDDRGRDEGLDERCGCFAIPSIVLLV